MKQLRIMASAFLGSALVLGASVSPAQVTTRENPTFLTGSDTLNSVMDELLAELSISGTAGGIDVYDGVGSSAGERQMEGSPTGDEDTCLVGTAADPNGVPETNPGCQEISPMSRPLDSSICEDDNGGSLNTEAEGLAVCDDGLVIITRSAADNTIPFTPEAANGETPYSQFGVDAAACNTFEAQAGTNNNPPEDLPVFYEGGNPGVGNMRDTGTIGSYEVGGGNFTGTQNDWKDVVRLLWTGYKNTDPVAPPPNGANSSNRIARCSDPVRVAAIGAWTNILEGTSCTSGTGPCSEGVKRLLRRDDSSGTTQVFLELLGVNFSANLTRRSAVWSFNQCVSIPENFAFCDGGEAEVINPNNSCTTGAAAPGGLPQPTAGGDPIKTTCCPEEDLCGARGTMGVVVAIRTPIVSDPAIGLEAFPAVQCNGFARAPWMNTTNLAVCPDGTKPNANGCFLPYFDDPAIPGVQKNFNCMNRAGFRPASGDPALDGRVYNFVVRESNGTPRYSSTNYPEMATWRLNSVGLRSSAFGGPSNGGLNRICTQASATDLIGCIVSETKNCCMLGFAGREAATLNTTTPATTVSSTNPAEVGTGVPFDNRNEPLLLKGLAPTNANIAPGPATGYPFARHLYVNALNGFENLTVDCIAAGRSVQYCADQLAIAELFADPNEYIEGTGQVWDACINAGFIPLEYDPANPETTGPICQGTTSFTVQSPFSPAGCGRPTDQGCGEDRECALAECQPE